MIKALKGLLRILIYLIVILVVLLFLFTLSYNIYLQSNLTKKFEDISGLENAKIQFDKAVIDIWNSYPNAQVTLNNISVANRDSHIDSSVIFSARQLHVSFKNNAWSSKKVQLKSIKVDSGELIIKRDDNGQFNFDKILLRNGTKALEDYNLKWSLDTKNLELDIANTFLDFSDSRKGQSIRTYVKNGEISLAKNTDDRMIIRANIDTKILDFTLNPDNGSFLKEAELTGDFDIEVRDDRIYIDTTLLQINDERLLFAAYLNSDKSENSQLYFKNDKTNFGLTKLLLSPNLQRTLDPYKIDGTFHTEARLTIMPSHPLRVDIDYRLQGNRLLINRQIFDNTRVSGHFVNDIYTDKNYQRIIRDKRFVRFDIDKGTTLTRGAEIQLRDALILSGPNHPATITSLANVSGPTKIISQQLNNDKFLFQDGRFTIDSKISGRLNNVMNIIDNSDLTIKIIDSEVTYLPSEVVLPLKSIYLEKKANDATFKIKGLTVDEEYNLSLDGEVSNFVSLLNSDEINRVKSNVNIRTKRMTWQDFIYILGQGSENNVVKSEDEQRKSMKQTLRGIQYHFQPDINIAIDSSGYYDRTSIEDINARIYFPEKNIVAIDNASFNLDNGQVKYDCRIDISSDDKTPFTINLNAKDVDLSELLPPFDYFGVSDLRNLNHLPKDFDIKLHLDGIINDSTGIVTESLSGDIIFNSTKERVKYARIVFDFIETKDSISNTISYPIDTDIQIIGNPVVLNDYLENDQFFFNDGLFNLSIKYSGENTSLNGVFKNSQIDLTIDSSKVLYEPLSVTFLLTNIDLSVDNDTATYNILMNSSSLRQEIGIEGEVIHMSEVLLENTGQQVKTTSQVYSPKIKWDDFIDIFHIDTSAMFPIGEVEQNTGEIEKSSFEKNLIELLYRFSPDILMDFDTIEYSDQLAIYNFHSDISLLDSVLYISDLNFDYGVGHIDFSADLDLALENIKGINTHIEADNIDIKPLLKDVELITKKTYPNLAYITGLIDLDIKFSQKMNYTTDIKDRHLTNADIKFRIDNLEINEAPWMHAIGKKFRHAHRFKNVRFAPIENELFLSGDSLYVPLMELQSSAFDMFIEGHYHEDDPDIWLSLPFYNLKERDISIIPEKEGYARRKLKLHLQYAPDKYGERKLKLRFSKRKFYKKRGL